MEAPPNDFGKKTLKYNKKKEQVGTSAVDVSHKGDAAGKMLSRNARYARKEGKGSKIED